MRIDALKRYLELHEKIKAEKAGLESRLAKINQALAGRIAVSAVTAAASAPTAGAKPGRKGLKRVKNKLPLRAAIVQATTARALTKPEIFKAIDKLGYRFATKDKLNSLNSVLYANRQFKNQDGRFSPAKA